MALHSCRRRIARGTNVVIWVLRCRTPATHTLDRRSHNPVWLDCLALVKGTCFFLQATSSFADVRRGSRALIAAVPFHGQEPQHRAWVSHRILAPGNTQDFSNPCNDLSAHLATSRGRTKTRRLSIYPTQQAKTAECIPCSEMALRVLQVPSQPPCPSRTSFHGFFRAATGEFGGYRRVCSPNCSFLGRQTYLPICFSTGDWKNFQSCQNLGLVLTIPLCS